MAGTSRLALALLLAAAVLQAGPGRGLPFDRVVPGTTHVVFYRIEGDRQFLFVYRLPERRLEALEIDRREGDEDGDREEAGEVVHHLPVSRLAGQIQYLALDRLPVPRKDLLGLTRRTRGRFDGVGLAASPGSGERWLGLARELRPRP